MLELKTKTFKASVCIDVRAQKSFNDPLIFYIVHKKDARSFFLTYVILDFLRQELTYIVSYYPENVALVEQYENNEIFHSRSLMENPHCSILSSDKKTFLTFIESGRYFIQTDLEKNVMRLYTTEDIGIDRSEVVVDFGCTFYRDENDPDYFYLTVLTKSEMESDRKLHIQRIKSDLSEIEKISIVPTSEFYSPHATRQFGRYLLNSNFLTSQVKNNVSGKIFESFPDYALYVYADIYEEYCISRKKKPFAELSPEQRTLKNLMLDQEFRLFCQSKGKNLVDICKDKRYAFTVGQGAVMMFNLDTKEVNHFETSSEASKQQGGWNEAYFADDRRGYRARRPLCGSCFRRGIQ